VIVHAGFGTRRPERTERLERLQAERLQAEQLQMVGIAAMGLQGALEE